MQCIDEDCEKFEACATLSFKSTIGEITKDCEGNSKGVLLSDTTCPDNKALSTNTIIVPTK